MTVKQYLDQIRQLDLMINQRIEQVEELKQIAAGVKSPGMKMEMVQTSKEGDPIGNIVNKYLDMEKEIDAMIDSYVDLKDKIIGEIQALPDPRMVELLSLRYIKYMRLEEIACTMKKRNGYPYSYDHIRRLHSMSLNAFQKCHSKATLRCVIKETGKTI